MYPPGYKYKPFKLNDAPIISFLKNDATIRSYESFYITAQSWHDYT